MNTLLAITLNLYEIIILQTGAIILGIAIHFFIVSRKSMNTVQKSAATIKDGISEADEWRLKFYEQVDIQKKWEDEVRREIEDGEAEREILNKQLQEARNELDSLRNAPKIQHQEIKPSEYRTKLTTVQKNLSDHNERISRLLDQVNILKESEQKHIGVCFEFVQEVQKWNSTGFFGANEKN